MDDVLTSDVGDITEDMEIELLELQPTFPADTQPELVETGIGLSEYEICSIIAKRVRELERGFRPLVNINTNNPYIIAEEELRRGLLPYYIIRRYPGNYYEKIRIYGRQWDIP